MLEPFQDKQWVQLLHALLQFIIISLTHGPRRCRSRLVSYICWLRAVVLIYIQIPIIIRDSGVLLWDQRLKEKICQTPRCTRLDPSVLSDGPVAHFPVLLIHDDSWVRPTAASRPEKNINTHISSTHPFFLTLSFIQIHTQGCIVYRSGGLDS